MSAVVLAQGVPEIPYEKHVLANGLTLIIHEDHKAPIVAVNVWYHVGSKNEKRGKTGFAHLFEHLMFNGSEHFNDDYFKALEKVGATDLNGTTNVDRTNYFQNVPSSALDYVLFLESDRMGHLLGAIDQAKLDEQRGVVQNEKRQGENQPYGLVRQLLAEYTYPAGHPYSWTTIGSMEDLNAASLEDVKEWFRTYYGPNNAVLVVAGDVQPAEVKAKVEKYFGHIPPGPPIAKQTAWVAKMSGERRAWAQDRVPQARVYMVWNVPPLTDPEADVLDLVAALLTEGKTSRLYKRLVYEEQIATDVNASVWGKELGSQFMIVATAKPGGDLATVEARIREELAKLLERGPTSEELERVQLSWRADFLRGIERIGGFGGKSDVLATGQVFYGDPAAYKRQWKTVASATPAAVQQVAKKWLEDGLFVLEVHPFPKLEAQGPGVDRSALPPVGKLPEPSFPDLQSTTLANGLKVVLAERRAVPLVELQLLVEAGFASDTPETLGRASLAMAMLDEGTKTRSALEISDELQRLGAELATGSTLDSSFVVMSALKEKLAESLQLFADVVLNPTFPEADFRRLQKQQLAAIAREKVTPLAMGLRVLPALLYGQNHPYAVPFTGSGRESTVSKLTREDLVRFHQTFFKPNNATLVVVGDVSLKELTALLNQLFAPWKAGEVPVKDRPAVRGPATREVYILDRPGSQQSVILAGILAPPKNDPREEALRVVHEVLGGSFTSRLNMNLREDKHWSYGARVVFPDARGQRPFFALAPVQGDKTKEALAETAKEFEQIVGNKPITQEELTKAVGNLTLTLPGRWETNEAVLRALAEVIQFNLPLDYYKTYAQRMRKVELAKAQQVAGEVIRPARVVFVVVGDRAKIETGVRELNLGPVKFLDADGKVIP
ncbi:MAG: insulinase family protein [Thermoanaerobaculum sp.]|nr:insulinase family protein [Thermoanaerobaculum sp.]